MGNATSSGPLLGVSIPPGMALTSSGWAINEVLTLGKCLKLPVMVAADTVTLDSTHCVVVCNKGSAMTVNLPAVASSAGLVYFVANKGAGDATLDPSGAETIGAGATKVMAQWKGAIIACDGATWNVLAEVG